MDGVEHEYRHYMVSRQTMKIWMSHILVPNTHTMREKCRSWKGLAGTYKSNHTNAN